MYAFAVPARGSDRQGEAALKAADTPLRSSAQRASKPAPAPQVKPEKGTIEYARGLYEKARIMKKKGDSLTALSLVEEAINIHRKRGNLESLAICLTFIVEELGELHELSEFRRIW